MTRVTNRGRGADAHAASRAGDQVRWASDAHVFEHKSIGDALVTARFDAERAAAIARVEIVEPEDEPGAALIAAAGDHVWGPQGTLARNELRALMHAGDPVHLARDLTSPHRAIVGFAVGFVGWSPYLHVHSHQVGVVDGHRRRGIGYALKLAQRHTCLSHGITDMRWTFDPLVRRNVAFNLGALGARATSFYVNFYGAMDDAINGGDASDRLEAVWSLTSALPDRRTGGSSLPRSPTADAVSLVDERDGWPELTGARPCPGAVLAVPTDYETLRRQDVARAKAWRAAIREVLQAAYSNGLRIGRVIDMGYQLAPENEA